MSNHNAIKSLIKQISGQANTITIPRLYLAMLDNDYPAAAFLNQCVYWSDKSNSGDGWFYKTDDQWLTEIGLSYYQVSRAIKILKDRGWLSVKIKRANGSPTKHYLLNIENLTGSILEFVEFQETLNSRNSKLEFQETLNSEFQETLNSEFQETLNSEFQETLNSLTKNTQRLPIEYTKITTTNHKGDGGHSKNLIQSLEKIGMNQKGIDQVTQGGWSENEILSEIEILKADPKIESIPSVLLYRIKHQKPSGKKQKSFDDPKKYIQGEYAQFINC